MEVTNGEDQAEQRLSFSRLMPKHQLAWDNTSLKALKVCPRFYEYSIIEGYATKIENIHFRWGSEYNNALVIFNRAKAQGKSHEDAMIEAVRYALVSTWDEALGRPWTSDEPTKTRETLIRSIIWYMTQFEDDPFKTDVGPNGQPALELRFNITLEEQSELTGEDYSLCGYLDRKVNDSEWITDWKSTKYPLDEKYFAQYTPDNQVSQYAFAGSMMGEEPIRGVIIDAVQLGVTFSRFQRREINRTASQLEEWYRDAIIYIRQNEEYVKNNYWPQNDTSCDKFGGCRFRGICSATPEVRPKLLAGLFQRRSWDPLVVREV